MTRYLIPPAPREDLPPPLPIWAELDRPEKQDVDNRLAQNAEQVDGDFPDEAPGSDIAQTRPPLPRLLRIPIPRQSGKEGAKNVPN